MGIIDNYKREQAARRKLFNDYGIVLKPLTKAQKKSVENPIPWTPGPDTMGKKIARKLRG